MAQSSEAARDRLRPSQFAYIDADGGEHLPIHDAAHVRNAIARFDQTDFESKAARDRARRKIMAAARKFDIEVSEEADVRKPSTSSTTRRSKAGSRGGRAKRH